MKRNKLILIIAIFTVLNLAALFYARHSRNDNYMSIINQLNILARKNFIDSYYVISKDIKNNNLLIFSESNFNLPKSNNKMKICLIVDAKLREQNVLGKFGSHYNTWLLRYASFQYLKDDAVLGKYLIECLSKACPSELVYIGQEKFIHWGELLDWINTKAPRGEKALQYHCLQWEHGESQTKDRGNGLEKELVNAVEHYRKAAEQGDAEAQYFIGCCYEYGGGVAKDNAEAVKWYRKAAEQGHLEAKKSLKR